MRRETPRRPRVNRYNPNQPNWNAVHRPLAASVLPGGASLLSAFFGKR